MIKVNDIVIEQNHFPDNTLCMRFNPYNENLFWEDILKKIIFKIG